MYLTLTLPRIEYPRIPAALRPALRVHPGKPKSYLTIEIADWATGEDPPPPINLNDVERCTLSFHAALSDVDEEIARDWDVPIEKIAGPGPRASKRTKLDNLLAKGGR